MKTTWIAAVLMLTASFVYAQNDVDFEMLNVRSNVAQPAAAIPAAIHTAPPAAASGQGAPYYYGTSYQTSWYAGSNYGTTDLHYRYQNVSQALKQYAGYYGWFSRERQYYNQAAQQGEDLYVRYVNYRDQYSAAALQQWLGQWEYQFGYQGGGWNNGGWNNGGWNTGYYCSCYTDRWGRTISSNCQLHYSYYANNGGWNQNHYCGCYYDNYGRQISRNCRTHGYYYPQGSYAYPYYHANNGYISGLQIGNGIGNIVQGQRYDNGLQTAGGVLSTVGGVLNVIDMFRR